MNAFVERRSDSLQSIYMTVNAISLAVATTWKPAVQPGKWRFIPFKTFKFDFGISLYIQVYIIEKIHVLLYHRCLINTCGHLKT